MNNVLYVNKPAGISSFDVCFKLRKVLNTKKIGHTGTLDPNATGVMIVLYNNATKANQFLVSDIKQYQTTVLLGIQTDTLDIDGHVVKQEDYLMPSKQEIESILNTFLGKSKQEVPITSAVKVNGMKLYQYQLKNKEVELPIRDIEVFDIHLDKILEDGFVFTTTVSSGTYIRALVRDILNKLDLIGTVSKLTRTMIDDIKLDQCDDLKDILNGTYQTHDLYEVLAKRYNSFECDNENDVINGKPLKIVSDDEMLLITKNNRLLAMYKKDNDLYRCVRGLL